MVIANTALSPKTDKRSNLKVPSGSKSWARAVGCVQPDVGKRTHWPPSLRSAGKSKTYSQVPGDRREHWGPCCGNPREKRVPRSCAGPVREARSDLDPAWN